MMQVKKIKAKLARLHKSLTAWVNGVSVVAIPLLADAQNTLPGIQKMLPENVYKYGFVGLVVANLLLRIKTNKPLEEK